MKLISQGGFNSRVIIPNSSYHNSKAIYETTPGNYLAFGHVTDTLNGKTFGSLVAMGLNSVGQLQWTKKIGNSSFSYYDDPLKLRSFYRSGNFIYYIGPVKNSHSKVVSVFLKYDLNGDTIWQRVFSDPNNDVILQMSTTSVDAGFYLSGFSQDWVNHTSPGLIIKTDNTGNELWRKSINKATPNTMDGRGIIQDSLSKKIIIIGYQNNFKQSDLTTFESIIILDSLGNKIQQLSHTEGVATDIIQTKDKNFVIVGEKNESNLHRAYVYKFNINSPNLLLWQNFNIGSLSLFNSYTCLKEISNDDILIGGSYDTTYYVTGYLHGLNRITRLTSTGKLIDHRYYDYVRRDSNNCATLIMSLESTSDGGWVTSTKLACYSDIGTFLFNKYDNTGCDSSTAHCATLNLVGVDKISNAGSDFIIFPSPANKEITISYNNKKVKGPFQVQFYNSLGQLLKEEDVDFNVSSKINIQELTNGIYTVTLSNKVVGVITKKLIVSR